MTGNPNKNGASNETQQWDPRSVLEYATSEELDDSGNFTKCQPQGWFPGINSQWSLLLRSLNSTFSVLEIVPETEPISLPAAKTGNNKSAFFAFIDEEPIALVIDSTTAELLIDATVQDPLQKYDHVITEYLARRFISSLVQCWSGPQIDTFYFRKLDRSSTEKFSFVASFTIRFELNGQEGEVRICLGEKIKSTLVELWQKQSDNRSEPEAFSPEDEIKIVLTELAVPQAELGEYLESGTIINLDEKATDNVFLRMERAPWLIGKLMVIEDLNSFGVKILKKDEAHSKLPESTTRVSFELGKITPDQTAGLKYYTEGAIYNTGIRISSSVNVVIQNEVVATGELLIHEGSFAVEISGGN